MTVTHVFQINGPSITPRRCPRLETGPVGRHAYRGDGILAIGRKERKCAHIGLLAGGTGVTPMLQIVRSVLSNPRDKTRLSLLFANQTVDDIFLRDELEALQRAHPDQFHLWCASAQLQTVPTCCVHEHTRQRIKRGLRRYTVDSPPAEGWTYSTGFINSEMINEHMPSPGHVPQQRWPTHAHQH